MKKFLGLATLSLPGALVLAQHHGPHVHGAARLEVSLDGPTLSLRFTSPLENLLGFEHAPRTEQQKKSVRDMAESLRKADAHFRTTPAARCEPVSIRLDSPVLREADTKADKKRSSTTCCFPAGSRSAAASAHCHGERACMARRRGCWIISTSMLSCVYGHSRVMTTGAWSLVPTSASTRQSDARSAVGGVASM